MILGLGVDIVETSRIARSWRRFGMRFARRVLHPDEIARLPSLDAAKHQFLASRFAVKEAAVKALGTGFSGGISPTDVCVVSLPSGQPELRLYGEAENRMRLLGADKAHVSLSHGKETVAAVVVIEKSGA